MLSRGKSPRLKGNPNFRPSLSFSFFSNDQHTASNATCSNLTFFRAHLPYLGDYVHFLSINYAHNSNSYNRYMKRCTRMVWYGKPCSCYLVHSHAFYKEWADISRKCVAIVNHKRVIYWVNHYTKIKYMLGKHDAWRGAMVWPHHALVKI